MCLDRDVIRREAGVSNEVADGLGSRLDRGLDIEAEGGLDDLAVVDDGRDDRALSVDDQVVFE